MSQIPVVCSTLKRLLRERGMTYRELARRLAMSEANVKRMFSQQALSLDRLEAVCNTLDLSLAELFGRVESNERSLTQLTLAQEEALASDTRLCLTAICVRDGWSFDEIIHHYAISEHECIQLLARLDRLKLIELQAGNKYKVLISRTVRWSQDGPLARFIARDVIGNFLQGRFSEPESFRFYLRGSFSQDSIRQLQKRLEQLTREAEELNASDARLPLRERLHVGLLLAMRPWELMAFQALRRS
jgi:DNA-binding Xre family transcriptional regulator